MSSTLLILSLLMTSATAFSPRTDLKRMNVLMTTTRKCNVNMVVDSAVISLAAGAIAGSIGVGAAYPLDSLKTKAQTYATGSEATTSPGLLKMVQIVMSEEGVGELFMQLVVL